MSTFHYGKLLDVDEIGLFRNCISFDMFALVCVATGGAGQRHGQV